MVYDCIVVGAGPAGGRAALAVAGRGHSVLVIDRKKEVGRPVRCAEAISHFAFEHSKIRPEQRWIERKMKGAKLISTRGKPYYYAMKGYSIDRHLFDKWLVDRAIDKGGTLKLETLVRNVHYDGKLWTIRTSKGEEKSRILIAADGPLSAIARSLGMLRKREWVSAMQYKIDAKNFEYDERDWLCFYLSDRFKKGYGWVFPRDDEYNVGCGRLGPVKSTLRSFCRSLGLNFDKVKETNAGVVPHEYGLTAYFDRALAIVGDAAGMTNPATGGGIHGALVSGMWAGRSAVEAMEDGNPHVMKDYQDIIASSGLLDPRFRVYSDMFRTWTDDEFVLLAEILDGKDFRNLSRLRALKIILGRPRFLRRLREFRTAYKVIPLVMKYGW